DESTSPRRNCASPQAWNSGTAISVVSRERSGMRERVPTIGSALRGWARDAPLGVPVVPDVRIVIRLGASGGSGSVSGPVSISLLRVRAAGRIASVQATKRLIDGRTLASAAPYSA